VSVADTVVPVLVLSTPLTEADQYGVPLVQPVAVSVTVLLAQTKVELAPIVGTVGKATTVTVTTLEAALTPQEVEQVAV
jgi:hypothetical protein